MPKIINGRYDDKWKKSDDGVYNSPVANYLEKLSKNSQYEADENSGIDDKTKKLEELLTNFTKEEEIFAKILDDNNLQERLLSRLIPNSIKSKKKKRINQKGIIQPKSL